MMIRSVQRVFRTCTFFALTALLVTGCSDDDKIANPPEEELYLSNNLETNLLENLKTAYSMKDIDGYTELFDIEQFTFVFDPTDVEDDPDLDPTWNWPEEFTSTRNMFESPLVLDVKVNFVQGKTIGAVESDAVPLEWTKIISTNIELEIDTIDPLGGENIIYKVAGDRGTFFFESYPDELIDGLPRKRIVEWRDERVGLLPVEVTTWGAVKSIYQ